MFAVPPQGVVSPFMTLAAHATTVSGEHEP